MSKLYKAQVWVAGELEETRVYACNIDDAYEFLQEEYGHTAVESVRTHVNQPSEVEQDA